MCPGNHWNTAIQSVEAVFLDHPRSAFGYSVLCSAFLFDATNRWNHTFYVKILDEIICKAAHKTVTPFMPVPLARRTYTLRGISGCSTILHSRLWLDGENFWVLVPLTSPPSKFLVYTPNSGSFIHYPDRPQCKIKWYPGIWFALVAWNHLL